MWHNIVTGTGSTRIEGTSCMLEAFTLLFACSVSPTYFVSNLIDRPCHRPRRSRFSGYGAGKYLCFGFVHSEFIGL
ncbi:hypothetical protein BDV59DRAFT_177075 [Aspergillus ambiguus]|uniref:uncharacterized protein n=1 Tax=Aspergillus ambiguus TaxID=176160 RepID=UPI003CCD5E1B